MEQGKQYTCTKSHFSKEKVIYISIYQLSKEPNPFVCFFIGAGMSSGIMLEVAFEVVAECGLFFKYLPISSVGKTVP